MAENPPDTIDYQEKYMALVADNQKQRDEFNTQRAKLKELFLQKEGDVKRLATSNEELRAQLEECQNRIVILELEKERELEEVASLKAFVQETINESRDEDDTKRLLMEIERLRRENAKLNEVVAKHESNSLAPVINQVKKFALKIGTDQSTSSDAPEDAAATGGSGRRTNNNKYAQEDAEVLRSLVEPLEEEIKALKEKLRSTDGDLQKYVAAAEGASGGSPAHSPTCSKCMEWELEASTKSELAAGLEKQVSRLHEDLERESRLRAELEREWQEKKEHHKEALKELTDQLQKSEEQMFHLTRNFNSIREEINQELFKVIAEREATHRHLETISRENALLAGIYMKNADELEEQEINLPNNVAELQELLLQARHSIIEARVGWENERMKGASMSEELQMLRDQLARTIEDAKEQSKRLKGNVAEYMKLKADYEKLQEQLKVTRESKEKLDQEFKRENGELREENIQLITNLGKVNKLNEELKSKVITLQQDLATGEAVQQDFVRLSQSLQMQLEKMRVEDTQVRWQDDDDVDTCSNCSSQFTVTRRKQHCRHCGAIYCEKCLSKVVLSGPRKKPAKVCDVCHTLLNSHTAPFFSSAVPKTP